MCQYPVSHADYLKTIKEIEKFLEGKKKDVERNLKLEIRNLETTSFPRRRPACPVGRESSFNAPNVISRSQIKPEITRSDDAEEKIKLLKYRLINLKKVLENSRVLSVGEKYAADVVELAKTLSLPKVPQRIEGYDISNLFGQEAVGSMVVFKNGEPDKSQYRKFKIRGQTSLRDGASLGKISFSRGKLKGNDTGMLREVLERRFNNDWAMPDLIIIDGGKGQLSACLSILKKLKLDIPILAVSKGEGLRSAHAPDKIFFPKMKTALQLPLASPALHIVKRVRDEAHRFAITYHRNRRSQALFTFKNRLP
jgi:excinuclease ABC subunit C